MTGEAVIRALLVQASALTALVPVARIYPGLVAQDAALPAIAFSGISDVLLPTVSAYPGVELRRSRVSVTVLATDYPSIKALISEVIKACNYQRGAIAGLSVISVLRDLIGPDLRDDDRGVYRQSVDLVVTFQTP